jgi:hypothetical protein
VGEPFFAGLHGSNGVADTDLADVPAGGVLDDFHFVLIDFG